MLCVMPETAVIFSIALALAAMIAGMIAGARKGTTQVADKHTLQLERLVEAQELRISHLEADNQRMERRIKELEEALAHMVKELDLERRITARIKG